VASLVFAVSSLLEPKYRSDMRVLVIQKQPEDKVDAFSAAKSAEYLSDIFSKVIYTDSFVDDVLKSPVGVKNQYSSDKEDRKKEWEKQVKAKKINNTGIIEISVFDPSKKEAEKIVQAISSNLSVNNQKYHGGGEKIVITIIDGPITTNSPASPNVFLNTLIGFILGIIGSIGYLYFFGKYEKEKIFFHNSEELNFEK
jgi:capsular polysaccharide biosynthesis protein